MKFLDAALRRLRRNRLPLPDLMSDESAYKAKLADETAIYKDVADINILPEIFHYWSNTYLRPMLEEYGYSNPDQFFAQTLFECAQMRPSEASAFISIGAGNCDTEIRVAGLLRRAGRTDFVIQCLDMNPHMLQRGREMAEREGVASNLAFEEGDFNTWSANRKYAAVMANQSLHHVLNLEGLFDEIGRALVPRGKFVISDMIGRNGHQRWPEALSAVHDFWSELPAQYRYNHQLRRHEELYENWDCSKEGFEGIRAQDILPLLLRRFEFETFIGFSNVIDVFIDRSFGHNFQTDQEWDRSFIDKVHAFDERALQTGALTPTHMMAVLSNEEPAKRLYSRGITPLGSIRSPD